MVKKADVVVENYRPGVMDRLGLGYDVLKEVNDQIIYAAVSGYGRYGRYSQRPGYDILGQAMGGLMSVTGTKESGPVKAGNAMGDILGGLNLTIGILACSMPARSSVTGRESTWRLSMRSSSASRTYSQDTGIPAWCLSAPATLTRDRAVQCVQGEGRPRYYCLRQSASLREAGERCGQEAGVDLRSALYRQRDESCAF